MNMQDEIDKTPVRTFTTIACVIISKKACSSNQRENT